MFRDPTAAKIAAFITGIGIPIRKGELSATTFLPGIDVAHGGLLVDEPRMLYCGDMLHETGHLAVLTPEARNVERPDLSGDGSAEMAAIAWSWAAAMHLDIDPRIVFHDHGYGGDGGGAAIVDNFRANRFFGVPVLQWMGMTIHYPKMCKWLRD